MKKVISFFLIVVTLVGVVSLPSYAAEDTPIAPCLNNGDNCVFSFVISSSGMCEVSVSYV